MEKQTLFIAATHGDEPIGVDVIQEIEREGTALDWIIGNPKAFAKDLRYIEADLNRSGPGDKDSQIYEVRRAAELIDLSKQYKQVIDIHGSIKNTGIFIIITKITKENLELAAALDISRIVLWPSITPEQLGAVSEYVSCGIEIECGEKNDPKIKEELKHILQKFLKEQKSTQKANLSEILQTKEVYQMYGTVKKSECSEGVVLQEFVSVTINDERITPVFIGSYDYDDVLCYKLQQLSQVQVMSLI